MNGQHLLKHSLYRAALHVDMNTVFVKESGLRIRVKFILKKSIICLFGVFLSHWKIFHSFGDVNIAGEGLQILTYAWNLWPLSSEGSLACHTYCDTGHPLIISEDPSHSHLLPSAWQWCHYLF